MHDAPTRAMRLDREFHDPAPFYWVLALWALLPAMACAQPPAPVPALTPPPAVSSGAVPAPGTHLSLADALDVASHHHPALTSAAEEEKADLATQGIEASAIRPHVSLEGVLKDGPNSAPGLGFQGLANSSIVDNFGGAAGDVVFSQPIDDFGRAEHRIASRRYVTRADVQNLLAQGDWVAWNVVVNYDAALTAQKLEQVAREDVQSRTLVVRQAQARFDAGLVSRVDVDFARTALAESQVRLTNAVAQVEQSFAELNTSMGVDQHATYLLDDVTGTPKAPVTGLEDDVRTAVRQRPEVQRLDDQISALEEQAKAFAADARPLLRTAVSVGSLNFQNNDVNQPHDYAAGLMMTWPFINGGLTRSEISQVQHQEADLVAQRQALTQQIRLQVTQDRSELSALIDSLPASLEALRQAEDLVKLATERYRAGLGSLIEVQQAQAALLTAATNVTRLQYQIATAQAALQYALGTMPGKGY